MSLLNKLTVNGFKSIETCELELQRLKGEAQKIPPKIRVFSFAMLMCFLMTYMAVIVYEIITSLSGMF